MMLKWLQGEDARLDWHCARRISGLRQYVRGAKVQAFKISKRSKSITVFLERQTQHAAITASGVCGSWTAKLSQSYISVHGEWLLRKSNSHALTLQKWQTEEKIREIGLNTSRLNVLQLSMKKCVNLAATSCSAAQNRLRFKCPLWVSRVPFSTNSCFQQVQGYQRPLHQSHISRI